MVKIDTIRWVFKFDNFTNQKDSFLSISRKTRLKSRARKSIVSWYPSYQLNSNLAANFGLPDGAASHLEIGWLAWAELGNKDLNANHE